MPQRMALYMQDRHPIACELEMTRYAEAHGFSEIWQADTRVACDCVVLMSAFLATTRSLRIGSGVLPVCTRNPAVIAATWSTMWELAGEIADGVVLNYVVSVDYIRRAVERVAEGARRAGRLDGLFVRPEGSGRRRSSPGPNATRRARFRGCPSNCIRRARGPFP